MHVLLKAVMLRWFACLISGYYATSSSLAVSLDPGALSPGLSPLKSTEMQILLNLVQCMRCI